MLPEEFVVSTERLVPVFDANGHVDEGTVHAWLDGAFAEAEAAAVAGHVATCASCAELVAEARGLVAASARVLATLDSPAVASSSVSAQVEAARAAIPSLHPQWWWRAAAGLFVVVGGAVLMRNLGTFSRRDTSPAATAPTALPAPMARTAEVSGTATRPAGGLATADTPLPTPATPTPAPAPAPAPAPVASMPAAPAAPAGVASRLAAADLAPAATIRVVVTGTVSDLATLQPIGHADVSLTTPSGTVVQALADAKGAFTLPAFEAVLGARVSYRVRALGYTAQNQSLIVKSARHDLMVGLQQSVMALSEVVTKAQAVPQERRVVSMTMAAAPVSAPPSSGALAYSREPAKRRVGDNANTSGAGIRDPRGGFDREQYDRIEDNPFLGVRGNPLSTFSIDVDRASYGNVRRFLTSGQRPPKDAVRIEEFVNYFPYTLPEPRGNDPVAITSETMAAPWQPRHQLVRVALQARRIETASLPPTNLVFLIDVSGSMNEWNKLPLVKQSLRLLVDQLRPQDRVAIVAYAGAAGLVLPSTSGDEKARIAEAIERLEAGGSTAGGAGIELAYRTAREHFLERGNNRVILATDGDFNVGVSSDAELERLVEQKRRDGTYLTVLGFGTGNFQASKMEKLAKVGNGNFAYVDTPAEARKVLVEEMGATLLTVANDVKLQVEFNPSRVQSYRLIGYENRLLAAEDFNDDAKDAGDIGAGHQVTALYEVVPVGVQGTVRERGVDSLRYVAPAPGMGTSARDSGDELLYVKLRYKRPGESTSRLLSHAVPARASARPSTDLRFIAAVASFGMLLRDSEYKGNSSAAQVLEAARAALGDDLGGYRAEFVQLVERWRALGVTAGERR